MIVSGSRDTYAAFGKQLVSDFTGPGNFTYWLVALGFVGALGYITAFRTFSRAFMALIIIAMVIKNGGIFDKLTAALASGPVRPGDNAKDVTPNAESNNPALDALRSFDPTKYSGSQAASENFKTSVNVLANVLPFL
jgi:hypothetical protein